MINPAKALNLLKEKNGIAERHPKFVGFVGQTLRGGLEEGDQLVVAVIHPDGTTEKCGMQVTPEDKKLFQDLGSAFK